MRHSIILATLLSVSCVCSAENLTERRMSSADIGTVVFLAPEKWVGFESYDDLEAAAVYELSSRKKNFMLKLHRCSRDHLVRSIGALQVKS